MACRKMLVLCGDTYVQRLWCAWELFTLFSFQSHAHACRKMELVILKETKTPVAASDMMESLLAPLPGVLSRQRMGALNQSMGHWL